MNLCFNCKTETKNDKYCSRRCAAKVNNSINPKRKKNVRRCVQCDAETQNQKFCSNGCQHTFYSTRKVEKWLSGDAVAMTTRAGYLSLTGRVFLLEKAEHKCTVCGWGKKNVLTGKCPLEIDHINGDPRDNSIGNLRVVCPNCHSLAPTAKALNSNKARRKYGIDQLSRQQSRPERQS